ATIRAARRDARQGQTVEGGSTITQQYVKNVLVGNDRTLKRKITEATQAWELERRSTKERILELYLNVAEWGDGIYGAEAASRYWFHKSAASLLPEEAALLTAMLPAPRQRNPKHPNDHLKRRAFTVLELYTMYGQLTPDQVAEARRYLEEMVAGPVAER
ncbi:MAG: transglycosylase domain-containing protein, partial [Myxococcales bacterium]